MRSRINVAGLLLLLVARICSADIPPADTARHISATLVSADARSLTALIASAPTTRPAQQTFLLDPQTSIVRNDIDVGGIKTLPATLAELKAGARIVLTIKDQRFMEVRLLAPPPVIGKVIAADGQMIMVQPSHGASQMLHLDPQRTKVTQMRVQFGPMRPVTTGEIKTGQSVIVLAKDGFAFVVRIQPVPPVLVRVTRLEKKLLSVHPTTRPGQPAAAGRSFAIERDRFELYHDYFHELVEPAQREDFKTGQIAALTVEDGSPTALTLLHPAVYGRIAQIGADWITISPSAPAGTGTQRFRIDEHTKIFLGKPAGAMTRPSGHITLFWNYEPGAKLSELRVGERVGVTAKNDLVLSMRVTPVAPSMASARGE